MALFGFNLRSLFAIIYFILLTLKYPKSSASMSRINEVHDCLTAISFRTLFDKSMLKTNEMNWLVYKQNKRNYCQNSVRPMRSTVRNMYKKKLILAPRCRHNQNTYAVIL